MNYIILSYLIYLPLTVVLTIWVARTLFSNGQAFLIDIFHREKALSDAVARLLDVGFYLVNIGFALLLMKITIPEVYNYATRQYTTTVIGNQQMIEILSRKLGAFVFMLGIMLFINFFILLLLRRGNKNKTIITTGTAGNI